MSKKTISKTLEKVYSMNLNVIDETEVRRKDNNARAIRITLSNKLSECDIAALSKKLKIASDKFFTCHYRLASEVQHTYFYIG